MCYVVGNYYDFWVTGIRDRRIMLKDNQGQTFTVQAYDYQTEWDWASPKVPVSLIRCYVNAVWDGGMSLQQDKEIILGQLYPEAKNGTPKLQTFVVEDLKSINRTLFLVVRDVYGLSHMFKPEKDTPCQPGDEVELMVTGIVVKEQNKSRLKLEYVDSVEIETVIVETQSDSDNSAGEFGEESDVREFKSTIVYPAGATDMDMDTQMKVILRTIAGFLNAQGGTLYIGVNDNGEPIGIEDEYALLNSSENDDSNRYKNDADGYQNKLRSCIQRHLGHVAEDYVTITFTEHGGHTVCEVKCQPSDFIIWYDGFMPYKRMGNRTILLRQEAIVKLIFDKSGYARPENMKYKPTKAQDTDGDGLPDDEPNEIEVSSSVPVEDKVEPMKLKPIGMQKEGRGSFYVNLFKNGDWSWSKRMLADKDLEYCLPISAPVREKNVVLVYDDGRVNKVKASDLHAKREGNRYKNGRRNGDVKLTKAFSATDHDLLACFSMKDGHEWVKTHYLAHISEHGSLSPMGNVVINTSDAEVKMQDISFVGARHGHRVSALMKTENQTSSSLGFQVDNPANEKLQHVVETLRAVSDVI